jgi:hypothetical protein
LQKFFIFSSGFSATLLLVFSQLVEPCVLTVIGARKLVFPEILFVFVALGHFFTSVHPATASAVVGVATLIGVEAAFIDIIDKMHCRVEVIIVLRPMGMGELFAFFKELLCEFGLTLFLKNRDGDGDGIFKAEQFDCLVSNSHSSYLTIGIFWREVGLYRT